MDEIFEGFASPLDLVEYLVKVRVPRPALEEPQVEGLRVSSPYAGSTCGNWKFKI